MRYSENRISHIGELLALSLETVQNSDCIRIIGFQYSISIENFKLPVVCTTDIDPIIMDLINDLNPINDLSVYNKQWRHFRADCDDNGSLGVDQIVGLLNMLKKNPYDRRLLLASYNPVECKKSLLSHSLMQFYVADNTLSCKLYQSSANLSRVVHYDCGKAVMLCFLFCQLTSLKPGRFVHTFGELECEKSTLEMEASYFTKFAKISVSDECKEIEHLTSPGCFQIQYESMEPVIPVNLRPVQSTGEIQYLQLVNEVLQNGVNRSDRTGVGTISIFGPQMVFSLRQSTLPLLTTKRVFYRGIIEELLWFLRGSTDANELRRKQVHIWDANGSKEFLESLGLGHREAGDLGPVYGFQWRHFGARYSTMNADYSGLGIDQIANLIEAIKHNPKGKDHILMAWNPQDLPLMALPPCHCMVQFFVVDQELSCKLYQRSADMGLGVPFNIASYALLTYMIAHVTGLQPGDFIHTLGDTHVYKNHVSALQSQLEREPRSFPTVKFKRQLEKIEDFDVDDFLIENYNPHPKISMEMAV